MKGDRTQPISISISIAGPGRRIVQRGFSMVELMVALVISLILLAGVIEIFAHTKDSYRTQDQLSRLQETARFAMDTMARDIRQADFWGCLPDHSAVVNNLNPLGTGYSAVYHGFAAGVSGTDGGGTNPDTLVLAGAVSSGIGVDAPYGPQSSANIKVTTNRGIQQGDIILISDCSAADIFQVTNVQSSGGGQKLMVHNTGNTTSPGNYNPGACSGGGANAHCLSKVYQAQAQVYRAQATKYDIQTDSGGVPALFRNDAPLLRGVENLQVLYGEQVNAASGNIRYVDAGSVGNMDDVVSIRFALLVRTEEPAVTLAQSRTYNLLGGAVTFNDRYLRRTFTATVMIRNRNP